MNQARTKSLKVCKMSKKRPRKATDENVQNIIDALDDGATLEAAAKAGKITRQTIWVWLKEGEDAESGSVLHRLWVAWQSTRDVLIGKILKPEPDVKTVRDKDGNILRTEELEKGMSGRMASWLLSKRFPQEFGGDKHLVIVSRGGLSDEERAESDRITDLIFKEFEEGFTMTSGERHITDKDYEDFVEWLSAHKSKEERLEHVWRKHHEEDGGHLMESERYITDKDFDAFKQWQAERNPDKED